MLFDFIVTMLFAVVSAEHKIDKRGKKFMSLKFDPQYQTGTAWIKTAVVYEPNKKGNVVILVNHGGVRMDTGLEFPASTVFILKPIKDDLYIVLSKGKKKGFATQYQVNRIMEAIPQDTTNWWPIR